jgi:uncharacterized protein (TIGR02452 family)
MSSNTNKPRRRQYKPDRAAKLSEISKETLKILPDILQSIPNVDASKSQRYLLSDLLPLNQSDCPGYTVPNDPTNPKGCKIRVLDQDSFDAAIDLSTLPARQATSGQSTAASPSRVAVLNLASERTPGGGFLSGSLAQEECLCYRSSLYLSLDKSLYPLPTESGIYSPDVVIIREGFAKGHTLLVPKTAPADLPVVSVISVAALRRPIVRTLRDYLAKEHTSRQVFASTADREMTKSKMRITLRIAAKHNHSRLVLGALGCGAFKNPTAEVANCWLEVLTEPEFSGGWWEEVVFAVLDKGSDGDNAGRDREGNFMVFYDILDGKMV